MDRTSRQIDLPFWRTLTWKLATVFFWVSAIGIVLHFLAFYKLNLLFRDKLLQITYWDVAKEISWELSPYTVPEFQKEEIIKEVFRIHQLHPAFTVFLLDEKGKVIFSPHTHKGIEEQWLANPELFSYIPALQLRVLESINEFLSVSGYSLFPIYGPRLWDLDLPVQLYKSKNVPFSAAKIDLEGGTGYVYVVLRNHFAGQVSQAHGDLAVSTVSAIFLALGLLMTTGLGIFYMVFFTRRFRTLTGAMTKFSDGDYSARMETKAQDEVGFHAQTFNTMAQTIQQNVERLRENDQFRRQLVANVSHDLRTPIGAIHLLMEALKESVQEGDTKQQRELVGRAMANCEHLRQLVGDLFELSTLEAKEEHLDLGAVDLLELLRGIINVSLVHAEKKELAVILDCPKDLAPVFVDEELFGRAVSNLVGNAIRYTNKGGELRIQVERVSTSQLILSVSDSGIGIPQEDLPHIFDRFYRSEEAKKTVASGTGLGLAITKRIVDLHKQQITVTSEEGKGSTFSITLSYGSP